MGFKLLLALAEILFIGCSMSCNVLCDVFSCLLQNLGSYKQRNIIDSTDSFISVPVYLLTHSSEYLIFFKLSVVLVNISKYFYCHCFMWHFPPGGVRAMIYDAEEDTRMLCFRDNVA